MFACWSADLVPSDVLVDLVVVLDGDGNVEVVAQPLTFRASSRAVSAGGSRGCSALSSTLADQLHVAVAVKDHDQDQDQVNQESHARSASPGNDLRARPRSRDSVWLAGMFVGTRDA
jgi:hypothetical protein